MVGLLNVLLRHRWLVALPALIAFVVAAVVSLRQPREYTSSTAFVTQQRRGSSTLSGLAAQLGVGVGAGDPMQSPQFYVDLASSRTLLNDLATTRYTIRTDSGPRAGTLMELYPPSGPTPARRREALLRRLRDEVRASMTQQTGVIRVAVTAPYPDLARQLAVRVVELVNAFNLETRQSQARAEREFIEQRLDAVRGELREAENRLQNFLQRNREYANAPSLAFERERLQRELSMRQSVYAELAQSFEQARIEEVRDTPVITVFEEPEVPATANSRNVARNAAIGFVLGALLGLALAFAREYFAQARREDEGDYEQFARLRRDAIADVTHPWRPVARLLTRRGGA